VVRRWQGSSVSSDYKQSREVEKKRGERGAKEWRGITANIFTTSRRIRGKEKEKEKEAEEGSEGVA
jgi:hypothetical protein